MLDIRLNVPSRVKKHNTKHPNVLGLYSSKYILSVFGVLWDSYFHSTLLVLTFSKLFSLHTFQIRILLATTTAATMTTMVMGFEGKNYQKYTQAQTRARTHVHFLYKYYIFLFLLHISKPNSKKSLDKYIYRNIVIAKNVMSPQYKKIKYKKIKKNKKSIIRGIIFMLFFQPLYVYIWYTFLAPFPYTRRLIFYTQTHNTNNNNDNNTNNTSTPTTSTPVFEKHPKSDTYSKKKKNNFKLPHFVEFFLLPLLLRLFCWRCFLHLLLLRAVVYTLTIHLSHSRYSIFVKKYAFSSYLFLCATLDYGIPLA